MTSEGRCWTSDSDGSLRQPVSFRRRGTSELPESHLPHDTLALTCCIVGVTAICLATMWIMEDGVEEMWIMSNDGKQKSVFREVGTRHICLNRAYTNENLQRVEGHEREFNR